ncbi:MAG: Na+/H+ antiporter subunit E [Gammaproteobacteria bacterium]|nr:Na+/H+ antiporter subunit E [Gammaproteobacteria bacterium]
MRHTVYLSLMLAIFWLLNSGHFSLLMISLGILSIFFVLYIAHRMDVLDHESQPLHLTLKLPAYLVWLIKEIILSNITVVKHIWFDNKAISPAMQVINISQATDVGKVIYANSITLTPGTVSVELEGGKITVHALLSESLKKLEAGEMDRRVTELEK